LYKPPLLMWVSGLSARILGVSRLALRLPVALLASLSVCLVFLWPAETALLAGRRVRRGAAGFQSLVARPGRDGDDRRVAGDFYTAAMFSLFSDPRLESKWALWGFAAVGGRRHPDQECGWGAATRRAGALLSGRTAPPAAEFFPRVPGGGAGSGVGGALVRVSTVRPRTVVLGGTHRSRDPGIRRRRAPSDLAGKPGALLLDAPGAGRPRCWRRWL